MNTIVFGGFLGSGKTSVILQLARYLVGGGGRVVILENEIGEIGVDDMLLRGGGFTVSELFAGCACCTMAGELREKAQQLRRELHPDWLILEATGVAAPKNIRDTLDAALERPSVVCSLADAKRLRRLLLPARPLVTSQLACADFILLNKIDQVDDAQREDAVSAIRECNETAPVFSVCGLEKIDAAVWEQIVAPFRRGAQ